MARSLTLLDCRGLLPSTQPRDPAFPEVEVPPELVLLDEMTHASWGHGLPIEDYKWRERVLRATPFSRRSLRTWVLKEAGRSDVLASCETYTVDVEARGVRGSGHGIASVYVEPQLRGHGHASELLRKLHDTLRAEGGLLCFLMSEIGPTLYERLGYVGRPVARRRYAPAHPSESHGQTPPWQLLCESDVLAALSSRPPSGRPLTVELSAEVMADHVLWHFARSRFYAAVLGRPRPVHIGARCGEALALWAPEYREGMLRILTLYPGPRLYAPGAVFEPRSPDGEAVRNVLHAARSVAAELGLLAIEVWENPCSAAYLRGGVRTQDGSDLPMLLGLTPKARGEDWLDYERVHWI